MINPDKKTRITICVANDLADRIDVFAERMGVNRTAACSVLMSQALDTQENMNTLTKLVKAYEAETT